MTRPSVDVVVPFRGARTDLAEVRARLEGLRLTRDDSIVVVDNTPGAQPPGARGVPVLPAAQRRTPGYARNRGAAMGSAEWIAFVDADAWPSPDLLDRLFDPVPAQETALIGGGVRDEPVARGGPPAARYAHQRGAMSQEHSFRLGERWGYPKTANAACRRLAFEAAGGFREDIRAAEDADLAYRLRGAGWKMERREGAVVMHHNRQTVRAYVLQRAVHGSGGAWLEREYPGAFPPRRRPGLVWWGARTALGGLVRAAGTRDRNAALWAMMEPLELFSFELGRSLPNERPLRPRARIPQGLPGDAA